KNAQHVIIGGQAGETVVSGNSRVKTAVQREAANILLDEISLRCGLKCAGQHGGRMRRGGSGEPALWRTRRQSPGAAPASEDPAVVGQQRHEKMLKGCPGRRCRLWAKESGHKWGRKSHRTGSAESCGVSGPGLLAARMTAIRCRIWLKPN